MSKEFTLFDKTITFTDKQIARARISQRFGSYADAAEEITKIAYLNKINTYEDLIADNGSIVQIVVNMFLEPTMKFIVDNGIYDFSDKDLLSQMSQFNTISEGMEDLLEPFDEIIQANSSAQQYRELRKESRSRVVGGGFGFEGAVKGMAAAGAMNAAAGIGHSIFNSIGNALDNASAKDAMKKIFEDEKTIRSYSSIALFAVLDIESVVLSLFERKGLIAPYSGLDDGDEALFENLKKGRIPEQEVPRIFLGLIEKGPEEFRCYNWGLGAFPEYKETLKEMGFLMCHIPCSLSPSIKKVEDLTELDKFVLDRVKDLLGVDYMAQLTAIGHENTDKESAGKSEGTTLVLNEKEKKIVEQKKEKDNSLDMGVLCGIAWFIFILAAISAWLFEPAIQAFESITGSSIITAVFTVVPILISLQFDVMNFRGKTVYVLMAFFGLTILATLCGILQLIVFKCKGVTGDEIESDSPVEENLVEVPEDIENKDCVDVVLVDCGARKMDVLKAVRSIANLELAEARAVVDKSNSVVKANVPKANAEIIKKDLEGFGARVILR